MDAENSDLDVESMHGATGMINEGDDEDENDVLVMRSTCLHYTMLSARVVRNRECQRSTTDQNMNCPEIWCAPKALVFMHVNSFSTTPLSPLRF